MAAKKPKTYNLSSLSNPEDIKEIAFNLAEFIEDNNLYSKIERKNKKTGETITKFYATVESWLYAGSLLNMRAIAGVPVNLSTEGGEIKYSCTVEVLDFSGASPVIVSRGTAIASNKEGFFRYAPEFSICSMSQTRAIGKAYRILIGHLLKVAGFEGTPSEEMTEVKEDTSKTGSPLIEKESLLDLIKFTLSRCTSTEDIINLSAPLGDLAKNKDVRPILGEAYKELLNIEAELEAEKEQVSEEDLRETPEEEAAEQDTKDRESNN